MKNFILILTISLFLMGCTLTNIMAKGKTNHKVTILEQISLEYPPKNSIKFFGISDLAYDKKSHKLYMVGDRSNLYIFSANFTNSINNLSYLSAHKIQDNKKNSFDTEGLTLDSKNQLLLSFEGNAQITNLSKKGHLKNSHTLPQKLRKKSNYKDRNKMLESIAYHPKYGIITAAEYPLNKRAKDNQTLYSLKGKEWHFKMKKHPNTAITALEVMDDGNILVLERAYNGYAKPLFISLKKVYLDKCNKQHQCQSKLLASFNSDKGDGFDNFEGLTKVGKNRYLMVSDNNGIAMLPTTLTYFKVNP